MSPTWSGVRDCKAEPAISLSPDAWIRGPSHSASTQELTIVSAVVQERNSRNRIDSRAFRSDSSLCRANVSSRGVGRSHQGLNKRHASGYFLMSASPYRFPLEGAQLEFQASALTVFAVLVTIPNSFGAVAAQLALATICALTVASALSGGQYHNQPEPARRRVEDANP
jgi:hypothetical protein